jgi:formate C-acetyltransferase
MQANTAEVLTAQETAILEGHKSIRENPPDRIMRLYERVREAGRPGLAMERAVLFTESFKSTEGEPLVLRWAKALKHVVENITITILDDELIVGRPSPKPGRYIITYPEVDGAIMQKAAEMLSANPQCLVAVTEQDKGIISETISPYWTKNDYATAYAHALPEEVRRIIFGPDRNNTMTQTLVLPQTATLRNSQNWFHDYGKVMTRGFRGLKEEAEKKLRKLEHPVDLVEKKPFLDAVIITCDAIATFAGRHSRLASEMAEVENDPKRRKELLEIAAVCERVPENPPRTFHEAVQAQWFTQLFSRLEQNVGGQIGNGRMDQYFYPFYKKDREKGRTNPKKAMELLQCLWINMWQSTEYKMSPTGAAGMDGFAHFEPVTIGGQTPEGKDATNELSYLILESSRPLLINYPEVGVRIHSGTPDHFLRAVCEAIKDGKGIPKLLNDEVIIPFYLSNGAKLRESLDYGGSGCMETRLPNRETQVTGNAALNYGLLIEMTLRNGMVKIWGDQKFGPATGDPRTFKSYDDLWNAFRTQMEYMLRNIMIQQYTALKLKPQFYAAPMASMLHDLAMEHCKDLHRHGEHIPGGLDLSCIESMGFGTAIDSLAAVRHLVFEEKKLTMDQLIDALEANFEGYEAVRQMCLNAPKYGNDDPRIDAIGLEIERIACEYSERHPKPNGDCFMYRCIPVTFHIPAGRVTGATPNGRKAGMYLSEGISASHGADVKGPTTALKSYAASRASSYKQSSGRLMNMKMTPQTVAGEDGTRNLMSLVRTWCELKLWHTQFNIVNRETLLSAKKDPEKYRSLIVRVAGYSAFFVDLSPMLQDEIIARTEESLGCAC